MSGENQSTTGWPLVCGVGKQTYFGSATMGDDCTWYGKIEGISDLVTFQAKSLAMIEQEFVAAVHDWIATRLDLSAEHGDLSAELEHCTKLLQKHNIHMVSKRCWCKPTIERHCVKEPE